MLTGEIAAGFEQIHGPDQVDLLIQHRIFDRRAHAGHGGQMDYLVKLPLFKRLAHQGAIANIPLNQRIVALGEVVGAIVPLDFWIIKFVKVVNNGDLFAGFEQSDWPLSLIFV